MPDDYLGALALQLTRAGATVWTEANITNAPDYSLYEQPAVSADGLTTDNSTTFVSCGGYDEATDKYKFGTNLLVKEPATGMISQMGNCSNVKECTFFDPVKISLGDTKFYGPAFIADELMNRAVSANRQQMAGLMASVLLPEAPNLVLKLNRGIKLILGAEKEDAFALLFKNEELNAFRQSLINNSRLRKFSQYLTAEEEAVLKYYTTKNGYKDFNRALRGEIEMTDFYRAQESLMNQALDKLPRYQKTVYRGLDKDGSEYFSKLNKGDVFTESAFTSFSVDEDIAESFVSKGRGSTMLVVESKSGVLIAGISEASFEGEVLFNSKKKFIITEKTFKPRLTEADPLIQEIHIKEFK